MALPNITLKLQPLSEAQQRVYKETGTVKELVFRTTPNVTKVSTRNLAEHRAASSLYPATNVRNWTLRRARRLR